ncbi:hypothetical protein [Deinococcus arenicola]|uniref:Uncharacterized protein n=1 Tax=Deinococcus arenicola TaxID=2994950 RepID=A0ABU4DUM7_9DEIO|nr:hypothetical protein [Deinococcus sp. ZS9-10]MDV6376142.1 hypothetical protein [Deinococcus sp. ZS9-10]
MTLQPDDWQPAAPLPRVDPEHARGALLALVLAGERLPADALALAGPGD